MPLKPKYKTRLDELIIKHGKDKGTKLFREDMHTHSIDPEQKPHFFYGTGLKATSDDIVEGFIATGDQDLVNDIITPNCMVDMLQQLKDRVIKVDVEHEAFRGKDSLEKEMNKTKIPIGKITNPALEAKGIRVKTKLNTHHSRFGEVKGSIDDGFLDAFSIAFIPVEVRHEIKDGSKVRMLEKVNLLNVAYTGNPINPEAGFTDVLLKSINDDFGGMKMVEKKDENAPEDKPEDTPEDKPEDTPEDKPEGDAPAEPSESLTEVKALRKESAEIMKELTEIKSSLTGKKVEEKKSAEERLKALEEKAAEFDKVLSKPQVKGRASSMEAEILKKEAEAKAKSGPLDIIG